MKIRALSCVVAAGVTLALAGCGDSSSSKTTSAAKTVAPAPTLATPAGQASMPSSSSQITVQETHSPTTPITVTPSHAVVPSANSDVPPGAAPGAGGPRPSNATPLTENDHSQYGTEPAFKSPSGHNGCQVMTGGGGSDIRCGTLSDDSGAELFMTAEGQIESPTADDAPMWPQGDVLQYGQVRYYGNTVFASTDQGVTVWNTQSGRGALINTSGIHQF